MTSLTLRYAADKIVHRWGCRSFQYLRRIPLENQKKFGYNGAGKLCHKNITVVKLVNYSDSCKLSWKRPEGPPRIWRVFEGRKNLKDGTIPKFSIQEVTEEMVEDVIALMFSHFLNEEPLNVALGVPKDYLAADDMRTYWRNMSHQGVCLVALATNSDPDVEPVIVGAVFQTVLTARDKTAKSCRGVQLDQFKSKTIKKLYDIEFNAEVGADVLNKYGVDKYLSTDGIVVHPSFRGHGLAENLFDAAVDMCLAYEIPVILGIFTMPASQILARRAGYEILSKKEFTELQDEEGESALAEATGQFVHVMAKIINE